MGRKTGGYVEGEEETTSRSQEECIRASEPAESTGLETDIQRWGYPTTVSRATLVSVTV